MLVAAREILESIDDLPSDTGPNATACGRAPASLPWAAGREPFGSSVAARKILSGGRALT